MNGIDLLEKRAERGSPRGAANVWANTQLTLLPDNRRPHLGRSHILFRLALALWCVGLVIAILDRANDDAKTETTSASTEGDTNGSIPLELEEALPPPLLIDGMELDRVTLPVDPYECCDDDFLDNLFPSNRERVIINDLDEGGTSTVIFADPERPFEEPILGLSLFGSGGFQPWGVNLEEGQLAELSAAVSQANGDWVIDGDTGLVEVARFDDDPWNMLRLGWQFDFARGDEQTTVQAEGHDGVSEWTWIYRLAAGEVENGRDVSLTATTVLDEEALVLSITDPNRTNVDQSDERSEIIWTSDDHVYRMTASTLRDNTAFSRSPHEDAAKLELVDRDVWVEAVDRANRTSAGERLVVVAGVGLMLTALVSSIVLTVRKSYLSAALAFLSVLAGIFLLSPSGITPLLLLSGGIALAWWLHRRSLPTVL